MVNAASAPSRDRGRLNLDLVLAFANTHPTGAGDPERFDDLDGLRRWLQDHDFGDAAEDASEADVQDVRDLRDALVAVLLGHAGDPGIPGEVVHTAEEHLRRTARRHPLLTRVDMGGAWLDSAQVGLPGVVGRLLAAMTEIALTGGWPRVKACRNEPCHTAFHDRSRNTSGAYCSPGCSSQVSMRAYRKRRAAGANAS